jgi:methyl-accepting chemotaxis protein
MNWNLRNRIIVSITALLLVAGSASTLLAYWLSASALRRSAEGELAYAAETGIEQAEAWVDTQRTSVRQWAIQPQLLTALSSPDARAGISRQLADAKALLKSFDTINLVDATGLTVASSSASSVNTLNVSDRAYFKDAIAGKSTVSQVMQSRTTGQPIVVVAEPIVGDGKVRGIVFGSVSLAAFTEQVVNKIKVFDTGYAFMVDGEGVFTCHPKKDYILKSKLADFDWGPAILQQRNGQISYAYEGAGKVAVFRTSEALGWGLIVTVPDSEVSAPAKRMARILAGFGLVALLLSEVTLVLLSRSITRPILGVVSQLESGAAQTASIAAHVSGASRGLAEGSSEQAASLEETSASLEELSSMTKRNADSSGTANQLASQARVVADGGAQDIQTMQQAMHDIRASSDDIAKIIKIIDEIAFQTNILALNAAVEAARAGEAGAGFAVVAEEVRALAQRSAQAAKDTAAKIEGAITKTGQGVQISERVGKNLADIVEKVRQLDTLINEVATASREQSEGVTQISTAIGQMDRVTQANAANAEETSAAAEELNSQSALLKEAVAGLLALTGSNHVAATNSESPVPATPLARRTTAARPGSVQPHVAARN